MNGRQRALLAAAIAGAMIVAVALAPLALGQSGLAADFSARNLAPSGAHWFGTDAMGRDLWARSLRGLSLSLAIGAAAAALSALIATALALAGGVSARADQLVSFGIDVMLALPHLLLLILISFALGGGAGAVVWAVALSHWPRLARILRAERRALAEAPWVRASQGFGRSRSFILTRHLLPHLVPQILVGFLLTFPHAILHEAGLSFLGFGLEPSRPAIGVMLADAMRHLTAGRWWLAAGPGLMLLALVLAFDALGGAVRALLSPAEGQC